MLFVVSMFMIILFGCVIPQDLPVLQENKTAEVPQGQTPEPAEPMPEIKDMEETQEQEAQDTQEVVDEEAPEKEIEIRAEECVIPYSGMIVTSDTTICKGTYNLANKNQSDYAILINTSDVTLDCNGATIIDAGNTTYGRAIAIRVNRTGKEVYELKGISVENCNLEGFGVGIDIANRHKSSPYAINSLDRQKHLDFAGYLHDVTIRNNSIKAEYDGILITYAKDVIIVGNTIEAEKQNSILPQLSPGIIIEKNTLHAYGSGIQLLGACDGGIIRNNDIESEWNAIITHDVGLEIKDNKITSTLIIDNSINGNETYSPVGENVSTLTTGISTLSYTCYKGKKPAINAISGNTITNFRRGIDVGLLNNEPLNQSFIEEYEKQNTFVNVRKDVFPTHPLTYHSGVSANCQ